MKGTARMLVFVLLTGCGSDRVTEINGEIEKLTAGRVEVSVVSAARSEADAAEKRLAATQSALAELRAVGKKRADQKAQLLAAASHEAELTEQARAETLTTQQATAAQLAQAEKKDGEIAQTLSRAMAIREQAAILAREIRPGDPPWAMERRVKSVTEFIAKVARDYPDDPVAAELAQPEAVSAADLVEAGALAAQKAARLRDRFTRVYNLDTPEVAVGERVRSPK